MKLKFLGYEHDMHLYAYCGYVQLRLHQSDKGYLLDQFKKAKTPTFDRDMKKSQDAEAQLLGMNKFYRLHD